MQIITPTISQFCHQIWQLNAEVLLVEAGADYLYVITHTSPFHPVSHIWPDHPADKGAIDGYPVLDCQVGSVEASTGQLYVGGSIPVKRNEPGWNFVVVHCLAKECKTIKVNQIVNLTVDRAYQLSLSRGHSAGHLSSLALNKVLTQQGFWRKDADRKDPHGNFDFNSYAQVSSFVSPEKCIDHYRLGKTIRKRGLNSNDVHDKLEIINDLVNQQLRAWVELKSSIKIESEGDKLIDSRYWHCHLGESTVAVIPCGGTHVSSLDEYRQITATLKRIDEHNIEMHTDVISNYSDK
jgi:alanyl-tRNA synthetase